MNLSTPICPSTRHGSGTACTDRRTPPWRHRTYQPLATGHEPRTLTPVDPVTFLEPGCARSNTEPHHARADRSDDTMRRLRTPFAAGEARQW